MKLKQVLQFNATYGTLYNKSLPIKTAYKLAKLSGAVKENVDFYDTHFKDILDKYALKDETGNFIFSEDTNMVKIQEDKVEACMQEINELENLEVDLPDVKFNIDEFDGTNLTLGEMDSMMSFITED